MFIALEGIDGSGKTEQTRRIAEWLELGGQRVVATREPTDGPYGLRYRAWARTELKASPDEVLELFLADRREHVAAVIRPALARGDIVVCDRYVHSTLAYQAAQGFERERLRARVLEPGLPLPNLVLWLRLPIAQALARLARRSIERFERAEFLARVDSEYARLGLTEIDASQAIDTVTASLRAAVSSCRKRA